MAVTNPQAVKFCNERVRIFADCMIDAYESAKKMLAEWSANGIGALIPDDATQTVSDGADVDGRPSCNGAKVNALIANATAVVAWYEAGSPTRIDRFRQLAVNGRARF